MRFRFKNVVSAISFIALIIIISAGFNGCSEDSLFSPSAKEDEKQVTSVQSENGNFKYITWNSPGSNELLSLNKIRTVREYINKRNGGALEINDRDNEYRVYFSVGRDAIDHSKTISMSLDDNRIEFEFGPSGTTFHPAAELSFYFSGLELSGVDAEDVKLYYMRADGDREIVSTDRIVININSGTILVRNAKIDHFSRYALGHD